MSAQLYDDLDPLYRSIWGTSLHHGLWITGDESPEQARAQLIEEVLKLLQPSGTLADIGCGYGGLALKLAEEYSCEIHACTHSQKQADAIPSHPGVHLFKGDWLNHQLPTNSLNQAVAIEISQGRAFGVGPYSEGGRSTQLGRRHRGQDEQGE